MVGKVMAGEGESGGGRDRGAFLLLPLVAVIPLQGKLEGDQKMFKK